MKICVPVVMILLISAFCSQASSAPVGSDMPNSCCFSYTSRKPPRNLVVKYYSTNNKCSWQAVVFITKKGREICSNPEDSWVQMYMNSLEQN
ncbi:PREDICTED: C-C motif chemokine 4-like [Crocodylus porosus]|uniref:C-C motif chemokine 4-like n=1 Tax=Crocodylus porosus TaxID=8502 RepID=A0A7M4EIB6_CROPO|nr:PREDICTED: C-C motif chemokine 4-like [Crocodylus porosus]